MNIKNIIKRTLLAVMLPAVALLASCDDDNYMKFDISKAGIYFTKDTLNYSFSVTPLDVKTYTYNIPVQIMGTTSNVKRPIGYYIDPDSTIAEKGVQYTIGEACILPDSIVGYIPVTIYRDELEGSYPDYTHYKLCIRLIQNDYFTPTLDSLHQVRIFRFDNSVAQPEWYAGGVKVWPKKYLGEWHPLKFIKMVEYFHAVKDVQPETYKKMVVLYGENLEHINEGDPFEYRIIFIKYVYDEMYKYFKDPANKDEIEKDFPDFFEGGFNDMPDPYNVE